MNEKSLNEAQIKKLTKKITIPKKYRKEPLFCVHKLWKGELELL